MPSRISACTSSSSTARPATRGSSEFRTVYWPGWVDRRMPAALARAPTRARPPAHSRGWSRDRGGSGCGGVGREAGGHAVEADPVVLEVAEDRLEPVERDGQV